MDLLFAANEPAQLVGTMTVALQAGARAGGIPLWLRRPGALHARVQGPGGLSPARFRRELRMLDQGACHSNELRISERALGALENKYTGLSPAQQRRKNEAKEE